VLLEEDVTGSIGVLLEEDVTGSIGVLLEEDVTGSIGVLLDTEEIPPKERPSPCEIRMKIKIVA